jgi:hypothetical protein
MTNKVKVIVLICPELVSEADIEITIEENCPHTSKAQRLKLGESIAVKAGTNGVFREMGDRIFYYPPHRIRKVIIISI